MICPGSPRSCAVPRRYEGVGVRRYGFHGLSYAYLIEELTRLAGQAAAGRVILADLGSGASMAATRDRQSIDTTMGLTPASGLVMSTRTGDIDPGLPWFLGEIRARHQSNFMRLSTTIRPARCFRNQP